MRKANSVQLQADSVCAWIAKLRTKKVSRDLVVLRVFLSVIIGLTCVAAARQALSDTVMHSNVSEKEMRMLYVWEDEFWIDNAQPADLKRHREIIAKLRAGQPATDVDEFVVTGHEIVPGAGAILVRQIFKTDPYPDFYILLGNGKEESHSRFRKLMIYLPDGIPDDGMTVDLGTASGAFALLTRGTLTDIRQSCFAYSSHGRVTGLDTKEHDLSGKLMKVPTYQEGPAGTEAPESVEEIISHEELIFRNVLVEVYAEFEMNGSNSSVHCGDGGYAREGIYSQIRFGKRMIGNLPWGGNSMGPLEFDHR